MYYVEDVVEEVFIFKKENVLVVAMEKVLRSRITAGDREIYIEIGRGRSY